MHSALRFLFLFACNILRVTHFLSRAFQLVLLAYNLVLERSNLAFGSLEILSLLIFLGSVTFGLTL